MKLHQKLFSLFVLLLPVQLGRHFWPEWSYVLGLRVDYLAPTVYLTDLLVVGILGLWGLEKLKTQNSKLKITIKNLRSFCLPFAAFCFLLLNACLAQSPGAALYKFIKIFEFAFLGFYIAKNRYSVFSIQSSLAGAVIYSSLIGITQFIKQASLGGIFWWLGERTFTVATPGIARAVIGGRLLMRPYATFPHPNVLAGFILVAIILLLGNLKSTNQQINKFKKNWLIGIYWILVFILALIGLVISFSRSVWLVGLFVFLLVLLKHLRGVPSVRASVHLGGGICLLLVAATTAVLLLKLPFSTNEAISQRLQLIKIASQMIRTTPVVGVGLNNFIVRLPEFWTIQSIYWLQPVHNLFLLIAAETGLLGLVIFIWFLILTFKKLLITNHYLLITSLTVILLLGLFDHYWFTLQQTQLLFSLILGLSWKQ